MKKFEQELAAVKQQVMEMGGVAESMVAWASGAFINRTGPVIEQVRESEEKLDRFQIEIDREVIRLITLYSPTARDLRLLLMMARINSELERIGDQAVNNCEYVELLVSEPPPQPLQDLSRMAEITGWMVHDALRAFQAEDIEKAQAVIKLDDDVDMLNNQTFRDLLADKTSDPEMIKRCMSLILVARSLERIADHATNICEEVIFLVEGEDIRHRTPASPD